MQKNRRLLCVAVVLFRSLSFSLFFLSDFRLIGVVEEKTSHHHLVCPSVPASKIQIQNNTKRGRREDFGYKA